MIIPGVCRAQSNPFENPVRITTEAGSCTIGFDYRVELAGLLQNWVPDDDPWEDASQLSEKQVLPLRRELLAEFAPYRNHAAVSGLSSLIDKYSVSPDKILVLAGDINNLDPNKKWSQMSKFDFTGKGVSTAQYDENITAWIEEVQQFIIETNFVKVMDSHADEYSVLINDYLAASENARVVNDIVSMIGMQNIDLIIAPSAFVNPGRNYATHYTTPEGRTWGLIHLGPFKMVEPNLFVAKGYTDAPISFNDREWLIKLTLHEAIHLLIADALDEALKGKDAEYENLLLPLEASLKGSYGELKGNGQRYLAEILTRAFTLEFVRRYLGETEFRSMAAYEIGLTQGYAVLLWRYLYRNGIPQNDPAKLVELLRCIPQEIQSWDAAELAAFSQHNEYSCTLGIWIGSFIPMFYEGNPQSFGILWDARLPEDWRAQFTTVLTEHLQFPATLRTITSATDCPFPLIVRLNTPEQFQERIKYSGLDLAAARQQAQAATGLDNPVLFNISMELQPDRKGVQLCWDIMAESAPDPELLIPYYGTAATHVLAAGGHVLAQDTLTRETRLISTWLQDAGQP